MARKVTVARGRYIAAAVVCVVVLASIGWGIRDRWQADREWDRGPESFYSVDPPGCEGWSTNRYPAWENPDFFATATTTSVADCLSAGANVHVRTPWGTTPLIRAARNSREAETLALLMDAGADPNVRTDQGDSALLTAAMWRTDADVIAVLLDGGSDPNHRHQGMNGVTSLHLAAREGNVDVVTVLLGHGADPNVLDDRGRTPLGVAAATLGGMWSRHGYHANAILVIRALLDGGVNAAELRNNGWTALHTAALSSEDPGNINDLIQQGHDPNRKTPSGWTALHIAALANVSLGVVTTLLDGGADPDARFGNGRTPLHCAAFANPNHRVIIALIERGADPGARTTIGWTPLHTAAYGGNSPESVEALLAAGASTKSRLAERWVGEHHFPNENELADSPYLVTLDGDYQIFEGLSTPLHVAAKYGTPSIVAALLNGNAAANSSDAKGETPLFKAMRGRRGDGRQVEVVGQLLDAGADPNAHNQHDQTPLHFAVRSGSLDAAVALLDGGADANSGSKSGWTPLHGAAAKGDVAMTSMLIQRGADPNAVIRRFMLFHIQGDTPLHVAADSGNNAGVMDVLLRGGANTELRNVESRTALFSAVAPSLREPNVAMVRRLIDAGADLNVEDRKGRTPLIAALMQDVADPLVVAALLDGGADPGVIDQEGLTPWELVERQEGLRGTSVYWKLNNARFD